MKTYLLGREAAYWAHVDAVMSNNGIKSPEQLEDRLKAKPKRDEMHGRVMIVDSRNTERVLGSIPRPSASGKVRCDGGDCYNVAIMPRLNLATHYDPMLSPSSATVKHVRFGFCAVNWNVVLTTDASLELLVQIRDFRLPGESASQAHVRQMYD